MHELCSSMTYENMNSRLLNELLENGRASLRSLADELDVSVTTVSNHLQDLEERGVVQGFEPKIDYAKLGYGVTAITQLKVKGDALPEVAERLRERRQMVSVYEVTGDHDIITIGKFRDTDDMNSQIKELLAESEIKESNTSVVLDSTVENQQFELPEGQRES
ncbi:MAG: HTH-type transcriptional regulator Lrp [Halobacteriaceae archaeon]